MKNMVKLFGAIALVALIGFSMAGCDTGGGGSGGGSGGGGSTGSTINGDTITSGSPVDYPEGTPDVVKSRTDFSYYNSNYLNLDNYIKGNLPLSTFIDPPASVTIKNGKVDIKLGKPKSTSWISVSESFHDFYTITPADAKMFVFQCFSTDDGFYDLLCLKGDLKSDPDYIVLVYVDKDVIIKGTSTSSVTEICDMSLKQGWNYWIFSYSGLSGSIETNTSSTTLPAGFNWTVVPMKYFK